MSDAVRTRAAVRTMMAMLVAAVVLQLLGVMAAGPSAGVDNNVTVTATQQGSDVLVTWTPVPESQWPPSNLGGPWTEQMFFVSAYDMNAQGKRVYYYCNGTSALEGSTGHPVSQGTSCVLRNLPLGRTYNVGVASRVSNAGGHTGQAGRGDLWNQGGITLCCSVPSAPRDVRLVDAGRNALNAVWSPSAESGGAASLSYVVTISPGAQECTTALLECHFTGLTSGVSYTVSARAVNQAGQSTAAESTAVQLRPPPVSAPRAVKVTLAATGLRVSWTPPRPVAGQRIARYVVKATPTGRTCTTTKTACTVAGLAAGRTYTVTVSAVDTDGVRVTSAASRPVTVPVAKKPRPAVAPSAPQQEAAKPIVPVS